MIKLKEGDWVYKPSDPGVKEQVLASSPRNGRAVFNVFAWRVYDDGRGINTGIQRVLPCSDTGYKPKKWVIK